MESHDVADVLVVGGCINGAGIARDAADRSFSVTLVEQDDLASYTSSPSTKLIHGGLHCLEYYEFRLVREALVERERLLRCAPYIIRPKQFVLPFTAGPRPAWMLRLGLFIYDHLGGRQTLARSEGVRLPHPFGVALRPGISGVFAYSDCWVEDSRLVVLNARDAVEHGARVHARIRRLSAERYGGPWHATVERVASGERQELHARTLVNAAGPWVSEVLTGRPHVDSRKHVRLVKDSVNRWVVRPVAPTDVVWSYAGVRPLYDDAASNASAVTREYVLDVDTAQGQAPLLSVFSGKITTFRRLASMRWRSSRPTCRGRPFLRAPMARRLARAYGTRTDRLLGAARRLGDLGADLGGGLTEAEVDYLVREEWAEAPEDIPWRCSKLGLHAPADTETRFATRLGRVPVKATPQGGWPRLMATTDKGLRQHREGNK